MKYPAVESHLLFERVDGSVQAIRVGTARPSRHVAHLDQMLREHIERVDPGEGVEAMQLIAVTDEPLEMAQIGAMPPVGTTDMSNLTALVDRLAHRLGADRIYRMSPMESDVPERSVRRIAPLAPPTGLSWPVSLPRPVRLLSPPQPVRVTALLPDHPPAFFVWRNHHHRVRCADGPERISGEWWKHAGEAVAVRDYFAVEDEEGRRFWLFRRGNGEDPATGNLDWFLHGIF